MKQKKTARIVITGGPGSGKTESLIRLKNEPELSGFLFFEEEARKLLIEKPDYREDQAALHLAIYEGHVKREAAATNRSFISDRGTIDGFAFYPGTMNKVGTTIEYEYKRYSTAIMLGNSAFLTGDKYRKDEVRSETPKEAIDIELALKTIWDKHPGFYYIPAQSRFEKKYELVRQEILRSIILE